MSKLESIIFIRHAQSEDRAEFARAHKGRSDSARPLSKVGKKQSKQIAHFMKKYLANPAYKVDKIISSPAKRTLQTIKPLKKRVKIAFETSSKIAPDCGLKGYLEILDSLAKCQSVLFVGHQPDIQSCIAYLTNSAQIQVQKGAIIKLMRKSQTQGLQNCFEIALLLPPENL
ncbi:MULTISPECIES: histidine phosphatase family protein [unclassified Helicobacter]|uniref:SixA phosphatase family protein n=1 Tax=unclassified Helicobacter TaxID=2593540 RepID=UPI0015F19604|nr:MULTISPECIES: phosphoglycerate mutase family protein [unclassified Helicobacter]